MVDVYWQGHRVGKTNRLSRATYASARIDNNLTIKQVSELDLVFDRGFAELYGITGVQMEAE